MKCDRPIGSNDVAPYKKTTRNNGSKWPMHAHFVMSKPVALIDEKTLEVVQIHEKINDFGNIEILINYCNDLLDWNYTIIDDMFAFSIAREIMHNDYEFRSITEYC